MHFITECFFLTAHALHIGPVRIVQELERHRATLQDVNQAAQLGDASAAAEVRLVPTPGNARAPRWMLLVAPSSLLTLVSFVQARQLKGIIKGMQLALGSNTMLQGLTQWVQLVSAWLLYLATGNASPASIELPLPSPVPAAFRMLPEYIILDVALIVQVLAQTGSLTGPEATHVADIVLTLTALVGSAAHVQQAYTRFKLVEALLALSPIARSSQCATCLNLCVAAL